MRQRGSTTELGIDGIIMTKMDGDSRGGAALSAKKVTGRPDEIRRYGRKIRCAGAVPSGADGNAGSWAWAICSPSSKRRRKTTTNRRQPELEKKLRKNQFTLEDFLEQMGQIQQDGRDRQDCWDMMPGYEQPGDAEA